MSTAAALAIAACGAASAFTKPPFPRIGGIQIGSPFNFNDPAYQASLARQHVMILGNYPGLAPGGQPLNSAVQAIKAKNPNALVFLYAISDSLLMNGPDANDALRAKINSMKWWLYSDAALKQPVETGNAGFYEINITPYTPTDAQGNTAIDWITKFFVDNYYKPNTAIDGLFMDNTSVKPSVDGDWKRNGTVEPRSDPQAGAWVRQGYVRYYSLAKSLMAGKYQIGNITEWGLQGAPIPPEYQGMVNGGVMEGFIGKSWSVETWGGWQAMMNQYRAIMSSVLEPKLGIFNQWGDPTDYQSFRYGLASCLMDNAYYSFTDTSKGYVGVVWFDEYNVNLGQGMTPPTGAWQSGVWRRDFDNGVVLVNPKGNGSQTVKLETAYVKVAGTQDPATNSGQTVTTVTLKDRDGIILLRKNAPKRPMAPQKVSVQP
jgi:hypothetical protein